MPASTARDLEPVRKRLAEWLPRRLPGARALRVGPLEAPANTGFSNDTLLFEVRFERGGQEVSQGLVARLEPGGPPVFPEYDLAFQCRILEILGSRTEIPVPALVGLEEDPDWLGAPFYVMERVEGRIPTDNPPYHAGGWMHDAAPAEREAIWWAGFDTLAAIHRLDWRALGLDFVDTKAEGRTPLERQLRYYEHYLAWATRSRRNRLAEEGLAWLREHRPAEEEPVGFCWGDARIGNMIFRDGRCVAVLDWEMATLGNPEQDLAWALFLDRHHSEGVGAARLAGFPERDATVARYEARTGSSVRHLHYYEVFAAFRFSVIMMRVAQGMKELGVLPADSDFEVDNTVTRLLAKLLESS